MSGMSYKASTKVFLMVDFPEHDGPININPCLTKEVSYNYITFRIHYGLSTKFFLLITSFMFLIINSWVFSPGFVIHGKISFNNSKNKFISSETNLDKFISHKVLIRISSSLGLSFSSHKTFPAVLNTDNIFLSPKS